MPGVPSLLNGSDESDLGKGGDLITLLLKEGLRQIAKGLFVNDIAI